MFDMSNMGESQFFMVLWITQIVQTLLFFHTTLILFYIYRVLKHIHGYVKNNKEIKDMVDGLFEKREQLVEKLLEDE